MSSLEVINSKDFFTCLKEAKEESMTVRRQVNMISKRDIVKQRLAQLYVTGVYNNKQLADILCISANTVRIMLQDESVRKMIEEYQNLEKEVVDSKLKSLREKATDTIAELLDSEEDSVRLQAVKMVLDKTGHGDKKEITSNVNITYEERLKTIVDNVSYDVEDLEFTEVDV